MRILPIILSIITICSTITIKNLETFIDIRQFRSFRNKLFQIGGRNSEDVRNLELARSLNMLQDRVPLNVSFPCSVKGFRSEKPPSNVHKVKPGDIDIIGAIGDSLTAGNGLVATNIFQLVIENRGIAWSGGGQGTWREFLTLPNILKEFNPNLFGYSLGDSLTTSWDSQFNVAEAGAISSNTPYMTDVLIKRITSDKRVKLKEHWKLITYSVGGNDFCLEMCNYANPEIILEKHKHELISVLRKLRDSLPRTIVNLVPPPNIKQLKELTQTNKPKACYTTNSFECGCIFGLAFQHMLWRYYNVMEAWQRLDQEIATMPEFHLEDFTVIYQPFVKNISIPRGEDHLTDYSNLSYDCFHLSQKFNALVANSLWNNMLEPEGRKKNTGYRLFQRFLCPTEKHPYIFTQYNSVY